MAAVLLIAAGCGPKPRTSESVLDNPDFHINQGMKLLERGDLNEAELSFEKALELDKRNASAVSGLALVEAGRGNYEEAYDLANESVSLDSKSGLPIATRGRVKSLWKKGEEWGDSANEDFEDALKIGPNNERFLFWYGQAKAWQFEFADATMLFSRVIEIKGEYAKEADIEFASIQKILRAGPGSRLGKKIALLNEISRADLAVLFLEELKLREIFDRFTPKEYETDYAPPEGSAQVESKQVPADVVGHWARTWILEVIDMGVMEVSPDGKFYPDQKVTRAEYALVLQNILITVFDEPELATKYIGETPRFKDMRSGTATYNAAALAVDRGVMQATVEGTFEPMKPVNGADALLIIRQLQNYLKISF